MTLAGLPLAEIVLGSPDWLRPVALALAIAIALAAWGYWRAPGSAAVRWLGFGLKTLGLTALAALLLEPMWTHMRPRSGENLVALVADNSQSLGIGEGDGGPSRGEQLKAVLSDEKAPWLVRLASDFAVRRYQFDGRLENVGNFAALNFSGRRSALGASLASVAERFKDQPLAAVVLFTDGLATDLGGDDWPKTLPPVYPVVLGTDHQGLDARIEQVAVSQSEFEDAPVTVRVDATTSGFAGAPLLARLLDEQGNVVSEQSQPAEADGASQTYRFQFRPPKPGLSFYRAQIAPRPVAGDAAAAAPVEATLANNERLVAVDRGRGPYRILYVSGRPNWEHKFLNRAILGDEQLQLTSLVRIARREPKFEWRSRSGESSNPLYRGFDNKSKEEAERYDQPVLVRLNTLDEVELRDGFPKTPEDLFVYHAIVLDDLEAEFFSAEQLNLLEQFVSRRGGGLLMLGGVDSLAEGNYARTPLAGVLPVYLDRRRDAQASGDVRMQMARDGWLQDWVRLRGTEEEERRRIDEMTAFQVLNPLGNLKPGAVALANFVDADGTVWPGLATQRFGDGRAAVFALGDAWRWGMRRETPEADLEKFWRQALRWLVTDTPDRVSLEVEPTGDAGGPVRLVVRARDKRYQPLDGAAVKLTVRTPEGGSVELEAEAADNELGAYTAQFVPRADGAYRVSAKVADGAGAAVGESETGWAAEPAAQEFRSLRPDRRLLEALAEDTGGRVVELSALDDMVRELTARPAPINETVLTPLWHRPTVFLFALACLVGEWGLRRRRGLP